MEVGSRHRVYLWIGVLLIMVECGSFLPVFSRREPHNGPLAAARLALHYLRRSPRPLTQSGTAVAVVQAADPAARRAPGPSPLSSTSRGIGELRASDGCLVRDSSVVAEVRLENAVKVSFAQDDVVVQALAAYGADQALHERILPRRTRRDADFLNPQALQLLMQIVAKRRRRCRGPDNVILAEILAVRKQEIGSSIPSLTPLPHSGGAGPRGRRLPPCFRRSPGAPQGQEGTRRPVVCASRW